MAETAISLAELQQKLQQPLGPILQPVALAVAAEIEAKIAPYPPSTIANSPSNPSGRWYERGYGPRWKTRNGAGGRRTSQTLGRRWAIQATGNGALVGNAASYAKYLHSGKDQAKWAGARGWQTDQAVVSAILRSGIIGRAIGQALAAHFGGRL